MRLDVSSESSARQRIHMKNQALFSSKDKSKKLKCRLLQYLSAALRINCIVASPKAQCMTGETQYFVGYLGYKNSEY